MKSQDLLKRFTALTASLILTFSAVDPAAVMAAENEQGTEPTGNEENSKDTQLDITVTDITQTADADDSTKINVSFKVGGADAEKVNQITIAEKGTGTSAVMQSRFRHLLLRERPMKYQLLSESRARRFVR